MNSISNHQAKYFAYALTREGGHGVERLQQSLLNATVDLNPHQVEAALFALRSPISSGAFVPHYMHHTDMPKSWQARFRSAM